MNQGTKNLSRDLSQTQPKIKGNARAGMEFGCSATPAPTPPGTDRSTRKAGVGAGISNNQKVVGAGVGSEEEVKIKGERKHRGKPPEVAGFSTPFPEGMSPSGSFIFKTLFQEVGYDRA
jgi:hypothetical protein